MNTKIINSKKTDWLNMRNIIRNQQLKYNKVGEETLRDINEELTTSKINEGAQVRKPHSSRTQRYMQKEQHMIHE